MASPRVVNFRAGRVSALPSIFKVSPGIKVVTGAGDWIHAGIPNTQELYEFDVFCCYGDESPESDGSEANVSKNAAYLDSKNVNKLICIIELGDEAQEANFIEFFGGKCSVITEHKNGPIFLPKSAHQLLQPGGIVALTFKSNITLWAKSPDTKSQFVCQANQRFEKGGRVFTSATICTKVGSGGKRKTRRNRRRRRTGRVVSFFQK